MLANREERDDGLLMSSGLWEWGWWHKFYGLAISARYTVMSGTPEKILELLLEAMRPDSSAHDPTGRDKRHPTCSLTHWGSAWSGGRPGTLHLISSGAGLVRPASWQGVLIRALLAWVGYYRRGLALRVPCP